MSSRFDRFMLAQRTARRMRGRLTDPEFRAFITALCLAGDSPIRGHLLAGDDDPVTAADIAQEGGVTETAVESLIAKLMEAGTLARDEDRGGCLYFPNWHRFNPSPKPSDTPAAWRARKQRQRERERKRKAGLSEGGDSRGDSPPSGSPSLAAPASAPQPNGASDLPIPPTGKRQRDTHRYREALTTYVADHFPTFDQAGAVEAVDQAIRYGEASDEAAVENYIGAHFPEVMR